MAVNGASNYRPPVMAAQAYPAQQSLQLSEERMYTGEVLNGVPNGRGVITYPANDQWQRQRYQGDFVNGNREGQGTLTFTTGVVYVGGWSNNVASGRGVWTGANGERWEGVFDQDMNITGHGVVTYPANDQWQRQRFEGEFVKSVRDGQGTLIWTTGRSFTGGWRNDQPFGAGTLKEPNGTVDQGSFNQNFQLHGQGTRTTANREVQSGTFENGDIIQGKVTMPDGRTCDGTFRNLKLWDGTMYNPNISQTYADASHSTAYGTSVSATSYHGKSIQFKDGKAVSDSCCTLI